MDIDWRNLIEALFRWFHVVAGIVWIGHLYFFNWVNAHFAPTLDADSKKKVVPELMPRALYFFRWGAAFTWLTGTVLLTMVYYQTKMVFETPQNARWTGAAIAMLALTFLGVFVYDFLFKAIKDTKVQFVTGLVLAAASVIAMSRVAHFGFRGYAIHLGAMFGTIMAFNVWFRIWPAQQKIIAAIKAGTAPDAALVGLAGLRSKHNTYMSVPLVYTMIAQHGTWTASADYLLPVVVLVGWLATYWLYGKSKTVKGF